MKKMICLALAYLMCLSLAGCGTEYEDTNGADDFSLQTITDENIIKLDTGASNLSFSGGDTDTVVGNTDFWSNNFNGVEQIYFNDFILSSDVCVYIGTINVKSGNFKLVAINNDEIIHEFDLDSFNEQFMFEDIEGSFSIHVAGESAAFEFHIDVY